MTDSKHDGPYRTARKQTPIAWLLLAILILLSGRRVWGETPTPATMPPYTLVALPDTQFYSESYPDIFVSQTQWIVDHVTQSNIVFVTHEGDIVNRCNQPAQWTNALKAMDLLNGKIPYGVCPGNHDMDSPTGDGKRDVNAPPAWTTYASHFGPDRYKDQSWTKGWYGGTSKNGANSWQTFKAGQRMYLALSLEFNLSPASLAYAGEVIKAHPGLPTIVTTHGFLDVDGKRLPAGEQAFKPLTDDNPQIFLLLCGHMHGVSRRVDNNKSGQCVIQILADYQSDEKGGNGYLRLLGFDEAAGKIHVKTYSPYVDKYRTDDANQFDVELNFVTRFAPPTR